MQTGTRSIGIVLLAVVGCSGQPGAIEPPDVDPDNAAEAAIVQCDSNGDDILSQEELSTSPALASVFEQYDTSGDRALDADEIGAGIRFWAEGAVGVRAVPFKVILGGRPLSGATVRLVPAEFLGGAIRATTGESGQSGAGNLRMTQEDLPANSPNMPLVQPGLYNVEITHPSVAVPTKYNTETTLGIEITSGNPGQQGVVWNLTK